MLFSVRPPAFVPSRLRLECPDEDPVSMLLVVLIVTFIDFAVTEIEPSESMHQVVEKLPLVRAIVSPPLDALCRKSFN